MKYFYILTVLLLTGCGTLIGNKLTTISATARIVAEETVDTTMDNSHSFICNSTYRSEMAARMRWDVGHASWNDFCGRQVEAGR